MTFRKEEFLEYKFEEFEKHNYCKNYRLNDGIKEGTFNNKYSHPNFVHVFYPENDYTKRFFEALDTRIKDKNNAIIIIYGEPHLGKSEGGTSIGEYVRKGFKKHLQKDVKIHLGFSSMEFDSILRDMKEGDIAIRDESPKASGIGSQNTQNNLNNITQIVRAHQNFFFFICPKRIEADVVTYYLETAGKNKKKRESRFIIYDPTYKDGTIPIGRVFIKLHDNKELREEYERKKLENINLIKQQGGGVYYEIDGNKLEGDKKKLLIYCRTKHAKTYRQIETQLSNYNIEQKQKGNHETLIVGDGNYIKKLVQNVYDALRIPSKEVISKKIKIPDAPKKIEGSGFAEFLEEYYSKNIPETFIIGIKPIERRNIIEVLKSWVLGVGIRDIAHSIDDLHQGIVNDIVKLFKDGKRNSAKIIDEWRVYKVFEYWCAKKYDFEIISGNNQPDFFMNLENKKIAGECKLWDNIQTNIALDKRKKFHVFNNFKDTQKSFPVIWRNVKWGDHDYHFDLSMNGSNIFNFERKEQNILKNKKQLRDFYY